MQYDSFLQENSPKAVIIKTRINTPSQRVQMLARCLITCFVFRQGLSPIKLTSGKTPPF